MSKAISISLFFAYIKKNPLECAACVFGAIGSLILSMNGSYSKFGFCAFFFFFLLFASMAVRKRLFGLLVLQAYFSFTSIVGIVNYF